MAAYSQNIDRCLTRHIGDGGLSEDALTAASAAAETACGTVVAHLDAGQLAFANAATDDGALAAAVETGTPALAAADRIFVAGTGGSSLGAKALIALADRSRFTFLENTDPATLPDLTAGLENAGVLAISKSGRTAEVMAHLALLWRAFEGATGDAARGHFAVVTAPADSPLRRFAEARDIAIVDHDPDLGGRYACLGPVGMIPAHMAGLDTAAIRAGAVDVLDEFRAQGVASAPAVGATVMTGLMQAGRKVAVIMPYADRLRDFSRWFCQLWSESLGKDGQGAVPYPAVGAVDQHSQLQLWIDGPDIAAFSLLAPNAGGGPVLDTGGLSPALDGHNLGDLMHAQYRATADSLAAHGRPVRTFDIHAPAIREREFGALLMHFMLETVIAGHILGVDPFNQPAVEDGKRRTLNYLSGG